MVWVSYKIMENLPLNGAPLYSYGSISCNQLLTIYKELQKKKNHHLGLIVRLSKRPTLELIMEHLWLSQGEESSQIPIRTLLKYSDLKILASMSELDYNTVKR
jgi:hypothetical protein